MQHGSLFSHKITTKQTIWISANGWTHLQENMVLYKCVARTLFLKMTSQLNFGARTSITRNHFPHKKKPMNGPAFYQNMGLTGCGFINLLGMLPMAYIPQSLLRTNGSFLTRSEEHTSELQSRPHLVCRLL